MKRVGDILASFLDEASLNDAKKYGILFSLQTWESLLKSCDLDRGFSHSRIVELEKSVLFIEADHPGWIQLLQTKQRDLLDAARRRFPELSLTGISIRLSRSPMLQPHPSGKSPEQIPQKENLEDTAAGQADTIEKIIDAVRDERLKDTLQKLEQSIRGQINPP